MYQGSPGRIWAQLAGSPGAEGLANVLTVTARVGKPISRAVDRLATAPAWIPAVTGRPAPTLSAHRAAKSVWERSGWDGSRQQLTVTRWLVGIGGGALAIQGLRQRSISGSILAGLGGSLAWWALNGEGDL